MDAIRTRFYLCSLDLSFPSDFSYIQLYNFYKNSFSLHKSHRLSHGYERIQSNAQLNNNNLILLIPEKSYQKPSQSYYFVHIEPNQPRTLYTQ